MLPALLAHNKRNPLKHNALNDGIWRSSHVCFFFLVVVNCMRARVHRHALPYALAAHLHPCTSSSPAGLLLVRAVLVSHTFTNVSFISHSSLGCAAFWALERAFFWAVWFCALGILSEFIKLLHWCLLCTSRRNLQKFCFLRWLQGNLWNSVD